MQTTPDCLSSELQAIVAAGGTAKGGAANGGCAPKLDLTTAAHKRKGRPLRLLCGSRQPLSTSPGTQPGTAGDPGRQGEAEPGGA
jgi:hypothetical protein